ncbi:hypothetical protein H8356DRAFT_421495 [Neocallimastix lanati (nom. inval.)]|uniref:NodB homology domain-containing protein n=1 Tax=Neocallimastix californiae TaxID=1754190 RepID=A0A1Y1ZWC7_9FUNG|nr:hypothetical protein H8356DRAFT_421495 [Neocallimastix sp. JGI-2020a]ORY14480.1 hypothetical protein LY90DRAFT_636226 [Neocallimastix californiae]|eukprot:ORY14480.1 hypothetical protein LY90DRAFT_636226 [Neocallimastix californiae]
MLKMNNVVVLIESLIVSLLISDIHVILVLILSFFFLLKKVTVFWSIENDNLCNIPKAKVEESAPIYSKNTLFKIHTQCKNSSGWALTYNDEPTYYTDITLDLLKKYNEKTTFFIFGKNTVIIILMKNLVSLLALYLTCLPKRLEE